MLLIFSSTDRLQWDFEEKFLDRFRAELAPLNAYFEVRSISSANHTLSDAAWVREMLDITEDWLERNSPLQAQCNHPTCSMQPPKFQGINAGH